MRNFEQWIVPQDKFNLPYPRQLNLIFFFVLILYDTMENLDFIDDDLDLDRMLELEEELNAAEDKKAKVPRQDSDSKVEGIPNCESIVSGCKFCGTSHIRRQFKDAFGINVCQECSQLKPDELELVSKTKAKEEFLLTDQDLEGISFIMKDNPRKQRWGSMKLFLRQQVLKICIEKYGSLEQCRESREQRDLKALERKISRVKGKRALQSSQEATENKASKLYKKFKSAPMAHVHEFNEELKSQDESRGIWLVPCVSCGFVLEYNEI